MTEWPTDSVWIGGSQSIFTPKKPNAFSDIDLYIIVEQDAENEPIVYEEEVSKYIQLSLGMDVHVYIVDALYKVPTIQGMEEL